MALAGWRSRTMLTRYGASMRAERVAEATSVSLSVGFEPRCATGFGNVPPSEMGRP